MRVLVACEESQAVCIEFRKRGHEAYSCDLQECSGGHPEWHLQMDVIDLLYTHCEKYDLMIGHPPCTYLSFAGAGRTWISDERKASRKEALDFFRALWAAPVPKICLENPMGYAHTMVRPCTQIIEPYYFGDPEKKRTCLWLKGLSRLNGLIEVGMNPKKFYPKPDKVYIRATGPKAGTRRGVYFFERHRPGEKQEERAKNRSKTFHGIARAMAEQWG